MRARSATIDDHERFLELLEEFRLPPSDPRPDRDAFAREWVPYTFAVEDGARVVGYGVVRPAGALGLITHVVSAPEARRRGVGRAVMIEAARRLRAAGCTEWTLNVRLTNVAAVALYESVGMERGIPSWSMSITWDAAETLARDPSIVPRVVAPEEDDPFERSFRLRPGRLAELRSRPGRILLGVPEGSVTCFDPAFPGATPFRARSEVHAAALLDAMRARARPQDREVRVHVEDDVALHALLTKVGAETVVELVQMKGVIP